MLLTYRLVHLIETHSDELAGGLMKRVQICPSTAAYRNVPIDELKQRTLEIYSHLGQWLLDPRDSELEKRYKKIGTLRAGQGVPLSQLLAVIVLTKDNLWEFVSKESAPDRIIELCAKQEFLELLDRFFDRALYAAAVGYERAIARNSMAGNKRQQEHQVARS